MRKRLRKKLHRAEFTEHVFGIRYTLVAGLSDKAVDDFLDRFLTHAVEANDLLCGGGGQGVAWDFVVSLAGRGSPSEAQRQSLANWLARAARGSVVYPGRVRRWVAWSGGSSILRLTRPSQGVGKTTSPNKGMKLTSVERIGRSQLIPGVRRT